MKRDKIYKLFICITALTGMTSCNDYLDNLPLDKFPEETVWSEPASAQLFVNGTYYIINDFLVGNDDWSDNTVINAEKADALIREQITEDNDYGWYKYGDIRRCNIILEKVAAATNFTQADQDLLMGEGYFLRASVYFNMARKFGRLMIVDKVLTPDDDMELSRTKTIKETYDFILKDLDEAAKRLPVDVKSGRISRGAAYALKAEVCLQGAAYMDNASEKKDYYTQAKQASEELFNLNKYSLDSDFKGLFNDYSVGTNSSEIILGVYKISENTTFQGTWMQELVPNMNMDKAIDGVWEKWPLDANMEGWMERTPSQEVTDAFLVIDKDGKAKRWDEASYYTEDFKQGKLWVRDALYGHRDKRFDATIVYDSCHYFTSIVSTRLKGNIHYLSNKEQTRHVSKSGYIYRKNVYESKWVWYSDPTDYHYVVLRLGRSYLNYAEAMLRLGDKNTAIEYINKTRSVHGGLPELPAGTSLEDTWKYYKIERRVELVQENDRYWSLLRWGKEEGLDVIPELNSTPTAITISEDGRSFSIGTVQAVEAANARVFTKRRYLLPVPRSERNENPNLANDQNPGW
ncbi:RagB/SusD family nutrient uptake outer membrane protein [Parabacteroides faecis]|uniref:RagB/SusD family nutrient uptake outer membrane protein n=1 Tax=Parabacteroides TaxID=375288 RepID=UPI000EFE1622|nr:MULTISPECIES: RagB/SusD family nutrient uptake outer membrane protein [Parabacteroides]MBC8617995.1 RagB/SusD family nutrient uptake outer membrane protein [Parabacteroides faecis]RHR99253.1 RagB/SusD family nutrient uptake outer membrane protein [Parabacteroides sp. AF14-59]